MEGRERRRQRRRQEVAGNVVMVLDLEIQRMEAVDHQGESPEALRSPVGVAWSWALDMNKRMLEKWDGLPRRKPRHERRRREGWLAWKATRGRRSTWWKEARRHHTRRGRHGHGRRCRRRSVRLRSGVEYSSCARVYSGARLRSTPYTHERLVGLELRFQLLLRQGPIFGFGSFWRGLGDRACGKSKFDFFAALVVGHVGCWDSDHAEDFYFVAIATGKGILYARKAVEEKIVKKGGVARRELQTFLVRVCGLVECGQQDLLQC